MSLFAPTAESGRKFIYGASACALVVFIGVGVFARNGWLPHTDALTGKKTGWFGHDLPKNAGSTWNPLAAPLPTATPQLSKEYIYAGNRLLAVEDANANAAPPADLAVWRPGANAMWFVLGGPGSQQTFASWGTTGDVPVPGDFDGDGKTDFSIYRPATYSQWFVIQSSDGSVLTPNFGMTGDLPTVGDFDGDGRSDIAVYRSASQSQWFITKSSDGQVLTPNFGTTGDIPAPADYDGDGKADVAVWRDSGTSFFVLRSSDGQTQMTTFSGLSSGSTPVPCDYDGDGKADFALHNGSSWIILQSSNSQTVTTTWGNSGDIAVPNDYDGDGKCDLAVWRPVDTPSGTLGNWYIRNSHDLSTRTQQWGTTNDIPVPAYYRR